MRSSHEKTRQPDDSRAASEHPGFRGTAVQRATGHPDEDKLEKEPTVSAMLAPGATVQRADAPLKDEEPINRMAAPGAAPVQAKAEPNRTGLPDGLKSGVENLSGQDLSDVRVHYNSSAPAQLQALAYAQGNDIHVGPGQEKHVPHEAWHVVQQREGRVQPTAQLMKGTPLNDDPSLEAEATEMGNKALGLGM
ncbi:eCIS core domain-containing protein [Dinghuibacter silviterrae]|uniref:Uncharacterized protein DUF4157 n=1 Tax=Dinghuibacter silviterrae TaxID=1539049 RepID=A0A4R8DSN1_9BACT|nr:DUF4157 domain-containing protein [Dinghuibacter silviterrae]TDX01272.1 uncharacterized protein DUF4157 [Dinghuibacter silviterrae]